MNGQHSTRSKVHHNSRRSRPNTQQRRARSHQLITRTERFKSFQDKSSCSSSSSLRSSPSGGGGATYPLPHRSLVFVPCGHPPLRGRHPFPDATRGSGLTPSTTSSTSVAVLSRTCRQTVQLENLSKTFEHSLTSCRAGDRRHKLRAQRSNSQNEPCTNRCPTNIFAVIMKFRN